MYDRKMELRTSVPSFIFLSPVFLSITSGTHSVLLDSARPPIENPKSEYRNPKRGGVSLAVPCTQHFCGGNWLPPRI
jgi:hypothetical protein